MQISAVADIVKHMGTPRALRGHAITCPVGDPSLSESAEKASRRKYIEKALRMLQSPASPNTVQNI